jgi:GalNAc-alpha-(1->4)-GalNAc-alpha-(1->3)-diNAcBac-PP-undecaprenol alpha-1,4-N-acetyl-D-galactosaminyltransferase
MHIAFIIPNIEAGGAERVASLLCNFWAARGHRITLVTFERLEATPFYPLHDTIAVHRLQACGGSQQTISSWFGRNFRRVRRLRDLMRELHPDIVVAFMTEANVVATCACLALRMPVVLSERNQPDRPGIGRIYKLARKIGYRFADALVVQTEQSAMWARARFRLPIHVIPNPVSIETSLAQRSHQNPTGDSATHQLIAVGRLTPQKGFDLLIKSFAALAPKHPKWRLTIYGEGPERGILELLKAESGRADRIELPGIRRDLLSALREGSLFVLPSRFEGYPNALLEALACGLPVVATSCPGGTAEILADGYYGKLVPPDDVSVLTEALDDMMSDPELREVYAIRARGAVTHLSMDILGKRWLDLFLRLRDD